MANVSAKASPWVWAGLGTAAMAAVTYAALGGPFFSQLLKVYVPRATCMFQEPELIRLHVISDALIALAYYSIPVALVYFVRRSRQLNFSWMFLAFAAFILACGTTHVMSIIAVWYPLYRVDGLVKLFTAVISVATAALLWPLIPRALAIPSPASLRQLNLDLVRQVEDRRAAEESLRQMQGQLEARVRERTAELEVANTRLRTEAAARSAAEEQREVLFARERSARAEAELASRAKDEFLAVLSHELRTPLNAITSWIHLLRETRGADCPLEEGLAVIERNTRAQADLIEDLLDMSRIVSGKIRMEKKAVDVASIIDISVRAARPAAAARGVSIDWEAVPALPPVAGDPARLQQVISNLLSNAVKFTPSGGQVQVSLAREQDQLVISVRDNGAGIPAEFLPHVFDAFRQADSSISRRHGGLGLGLTISRSLVDLHGGSIHAASPGIGQGSTFTVRLPAPAGATAIETTAAGSGAPPPAAPRPLAGLSVLVVEDEPDTREVIARIFARAGAEVATACDAAAAWDRLQVRLPAVLVSDIGLPGEDGYSFVARLRALPAEKGGAVPAVALTAFARLEDGAKATAAGFQRHMAKPVDAALLIEAVRELAVGAAGSRTPR